MKTEKELLEKQARELEGLRRENKVRELIPEAFRDDSFICIHSDHICVKMWPYFRTTKKLSDALEIVRLFEPEIITCEHWKDGCVSTYPAQINATSKRDNAVMDGSHVVEIKVHGGCGFGPDVEIQFWVESSCGLLEIICPVSDLYRLIPSVSPNYNRHGELTSCEIKWPVESRCVDSFRTFWSEKPSYSGSYYLADMPNFYSWASKFETA